MDNSINNAEDAKERVMYSKCDNPVITSKSDNIMINDEADEVIKEFFDSVISRYDSSLESIKGSEPVFGYVYLLYYKYSK